MNNVMPYIKTYLLPVVAVVVVLFVAKWLAHRLTSQVERQLTKAKFDATLTRFFANATGWAVWIVAVIAVLNYFGVQTASLVALLGAGSLAVGLAFQGSLANFASGVMLLVFRPFKVGDTVSIGGVSGKVCEIALFSTNVDTPDNRRVIVPNKAIFGATIENVSFHPTRRVDVAVGTDYGADLDQVRQVLLDAALAVEGRIEEPAAKIVLSGLGGSSIDWQVRVWCNSADYFAVKDRLTRDVKVALDKANIGIPFPQLDVHLDAEVSKGLSKGL